MRPHNTFFELQKLVNDLAFINRNHNLIASERKENDIEHSFMVAMLCWFIYDQHHIPLDLSKIIRYALVHDFVERYAGDTNTYASQEDRAKKIVREQSALKKLTKEFSDFSDLVECLTHYEEKKDEESLFVWTVDKMQSLVLADLDNWRPYQQIDISYDRFVQKHSEQLAKGSPYCKDIFATLLDYCKTTYYDQP